MFPVTATTSVESSLTVLIGGFHICEKTWQPVNFQVTFKKLAPKAFAKILHRVALKILFIHCAVYDLEATLVVLTSLIATRVVN